MLALTLLLLGLQTFPLSSSHRIWLDEEVHFLIGAGERQRFLELDSDEARQGFIDTFWLGRNRAEHVERLQASDRLFGPRGRFSERGRIYQLLGRPSFREDFARAGHRLVPTELWHYTGVSVSFLPDSFYLIFFRPGGSGYYRLWSLTADGVAALVATAEPTRFTLDSFSEELELVDPELAIAVRELVPGGGPLGTQSLLVNLERYADLAERDRMVTTRVRADANMETLTGHLVAAVFRDDASVPELHYAIELDLDENRRLPWRQSGERWRTRFTVHGRFARGDAELESWEDTLELDVTDEERERLSSTLLSFQGRRLLPAGAERFEAAIVAEDGRGTILGSDELTPLLLARTSPGRARAGRLPFAVGGMLLIPRPLHNVTERSVVAVTELDSGEAASIHWELWCGDELQSSKEYVAQGATVAMKAIALDDRPELYRVRVTSGRSTRELRFRTERKRDASPVRVLAREPTRDEERRYRLARARAFSLQGSVHEAIEEMETVVELRPDDALAHLDLARLNYQAGRYTEVLRRLRAVEAELDNEADLFVLMAASAEALGFIEEAVSHYEKAMSLAPENVELKRTLEEARSRLR